MRKNSSIDVILGILFLFLGILSLNRPVQTLGILVIYFGILAIIRGITSIIGLDSFSTEKPVVFRIILGVLDVVIGVIFITNLITGALLLGIIFSVWFMIESISNLFINNRYNKKSGLKKTFILFFDLICLIFAVILMFNPLIATLTLPRLVGFSSLAFGVALIFQGIHR